MAAVGAGQALLKRRGKKIQEIINKILIYISLEFIFFGEASHGGRGKWRTLSLEPSACTASSLLSHRKNSQCRQCPRHPSKGLMRLVLYRVRH